MAYPLVRRCALVSKQYIRLTLSAHSEQSRTDLLDTQGWWRIAWSFYAAAMGSWALFSPGSYAYYAGILGLAMYAFASGAAQSKPPSDLPSHIRITLTHGASTVVQHALHLMSMMRSHVITLCWHLSQGCRSF